MSIRDNIRTAITNALEFIDATHGHKSGAIYEDLAEALKQLDAIDVMPSGIYQD